MSPWKPFKSLVGFDSPGGTQNVTRLEGESSANTVWSLRSRIRCNVGDEISADRWSIYSSEKFEKLSQIDMEADYSVLILNFSANC